MNGPDKAIEGTKKASITTLGCRSNQYDSFAIEEALKGRGIEVVPFPSRADAYIINTCTVTARTDAQSRRLINGVKRLNPDALIIVTGCFAQVSPEEVGRINGVDYIFGNPQKEQVAECVVSGRKRDRPETVVGDGKDGTPLTLRARRQGRTRANLKIQEGCSRACTYCIIPKARGVSRSLPPDEAIREAELLIEGGFKEIVLTGIHLGAYGEETNGGTGLTPLLKLIEEKTFPGPCRFRLSSLDPDEVGADLIELLKGAKKICNHIHLPLQSGDNSIIKKMARPYTREVFADKVMKLASSVNGISIGVDVIAGFPGEGEKEFNNTYSLLRDLPVSYLHVFPFSKRKGTPAAAFSAMVGSRVIKERCERLQELDRAKREDFYRGFAGGAAEVLAEGEPDIKSGLMKGKARNYIPVSFAGSEAMKNTFVNVRIEGFDERGMTGSAIEGRI